MKPAAAEKTAPIRNPNAVPQPDPEEEDERDDRDRHVLAPKIGRGALLDGAPNLLHALRSR
jgi:hypothetical protein